MLEMCCKTERIGLGAQRVLGGVCEYCEVQTSVIGGLQVGMRFGMYFGGN